MSKNITIKSDGVETDYNNVTSIMTSSSGGNERWLPEDDTHTTTITITEDGQYEPDGYYGYSQVVVAVSGNLGEKTITENGTYNASDDGFDAYSSVTVNVPVQAPLSIAFRDDPAFFAGQVVDYTGIFVDATWQDGSVTDVTDHCTFDPPAGYVIPENAATIIVTATWNSEVS